MQSTFHPQTKGYQNSCGINNQDDAKYVKRYCAMPCKQVGSVSADRGKVGNAKRSRCESIKSHLVVEHTDFITPTLRTSIRVSSSVMMVQRLTHAADGGFAHGRGSSVCHGSGTGWHP